MGGFDQQLIGAKLRLAGRVIAVALDHRVGRLPDFAVGDHVEK